MPLRRERFFFDEAGSEEESFDPRETELRRVRPSPSATIAGAFRVTGRPLALGPLIVFGVFGAVAGVFWPTVSHLLTSWGENDLGNHALLVVLVVWVLIWNLRDELSVLPMRPFFFGFVGLIALGFIWLSGQLVYTLVFTQFAVLAMVPMVVLTLLGVRWLTTLAFPFFVLVFALPLWGPLVPTLVRWTAKFVELGIRASGVPIYREGAYFVLPSGSWSIADACSGAAFLSTCLLLGVLYAWTIYDSPRKRLLFVAGSAIIGVVGNWIRVYLTMMIAHLTDNRWLRNDHYTFGWWLFAVFLSVFCWLGWRYRDAQQSKSPLVQSNSEGQSPGSSHPERAGVLHFVALPAAVVATMLVWPITESKLSSPHGTGTSKIEIAEISPRSGWSPVVKPSADWTPELNNPSQVRVQTFEKGSHRVSVFVGIFANESWSSKLVSAANQLAGGGKSNWSLAERGVAHTEIAGKPLDMETGIVLGGRGRIVAWHWYWIDGVSTGNALRAKFEQLLIRLSGGRTTSAWVAIYTVAETASESPSNLLQEFTRDMGGALQSALVKTTKNDGS